MLSHHFGVPKQRQNALGFVGVILNQVIPHLQGIGCEEVVAVRAYVAVNSLQWRALRAVLAQMVVNAIHKATRPALVQPLNGSVESETFALEGVQIPSGLVAGLKYEGVESRF